MYLVVKNLDLKLGFGIYELFSVFCSTAGNQAKSSFFGPEIYSLNARPCPFCLMRHVLSWLPQKTSSPRQTFFGIVQCICVCLCVCVCVF